MASQIVASAAAASSDPVWTYPAAKPATAARVPHTSASPNRSRHALHHPAGRLGTDGAAATAPAPVASGLPAVTTATAARSIDTPLTAPPHLLSTESGSAGPDTPTGRAGPGRSRKRRRRRAR